MAFCASVLSLGSWESWWCGASVPSQRMRDWPTELLYRSIATRARSRGTAGLRIGRGGRGGGAGQGGPARRGEGFNSILIHDLEPGLVRRRAAQLLGGERRRFAAGRPEAVLLALPNDDRGAGTGGDEFRRIDRVDGDRPPDRQPGADVPLPDPFAQDVAVLVVGRVQAGDAAGGDRALAPDEPNRRR